MRALVINVSLLIEAKVREIDVVWPFNDRNSLIRTTYRSDRQIDKINIVLVVVVISGFLIYFIFSKIE